MPSKNVETKKAETAAEKTKEVRLVPKDIDLSQVITVYNGFQGRLIYCSKRTGEKFEWSEFGDDQDIELRELRNAKSSSKEFFEKNWFMFKDEDSWVIDFLGVSKYYKNSVNIDKFRDVFNHKPDQIKKIISKMPEGQKKSLSYLARQLVMNKEIDSLSVIDALEEALGTELVER